MGPTMRDGGWSGGVVRRCYWTTDDDAGWLVYLFELIESCRDGRHRLCNEKSI